MALVWRMVRTTFRNCLEPTLTATHPNALRYCSSLCAAIGNSSSYPSPTYVLCMCCQDSHNVEVLDVIKSQVGMSDYFAAIQGLKQSPDFAAGVSGMQVPKTAVQRLVLEDGQGMS